MAASCASQEASKETGGSLKERGEEILSNGIGGAEGLLFLRPVYCASFNGNETLFGRGRVNADVCELVRS